MQPAFADLVHFVTVPVSAATTFVFFLAMRSFPWCAPVPRGAPKSSTYDALPRTGKTRRGTAAWVVAGTAHPRTRRKRTAAAVVRWRLMGAGAPVRPRKARG